MRFDLIIANPPYNGKNKGDSSPLGLRIMSYSKSMTDTFIFLVPINLFQMYDPRETSSFFKKITEAVLPFIQSIDVISAQEANKQFKIGLRSNIGIIKGNNKQNNFDITSFQENNSIIKKIRSKLSEGSLVKVIKNYLDQRYVNNEFWIEWNMWFNPRNPKALSNLFEPTINPHKHIRVQIIPYHDPYVLKNMITAYNSTLWRYYSIKTTFGQHKKPSLVPFPGFDFFKEPCDDQRFCDYFSITNDEYQIIEKEMESQI